MNKLPSGTMVRYTGEKGQYNGRVGVLTGYNDTGTVHVVFSEYETLNVLPMTLEIVENYWTVHEPPKKVEKELWEYHHISASTDSYNDVPDYFEDSMDEAGDYGWECISVVISNNNVNAFFKRKRNNV